MVKYDKATAERGRTYVEDRRGSGGRRRGGGMSMGGGGLPMGKVGGIGGIIVTLIMMFLGGGSLLGGGSSSSFDLGSPSGGSPIDPANDPDAATVEFMGALMADIQDTWSEKFADAGRQYEPTSMVIFDGQVRTGCGNATAAVGPFYCPAPGDNKVYIDLAFYNELARRFGAPGDFAQAYVIAHEVGHHIQYVTGISDQVREAQGNDPRNKNYYSIRQELQADCFAGVWAHDANANNTGLGVSLERGDIAEGLQAAAAVGDDRIQEQAGMTVDPHSWTHGSAEQRQAWFTIGFDSGDPEMCDTFANPTP